MFEKERGVAPADQLCELICDVARKPMQYVKHDDASDDDLEVKPKVAPVVQIVQVTRFDYSRFFMSYVRLSSRGDFQIHPSVTLNIIEGVRGNALALAVYSSLYSPHADFLHCRVYLMNALFEKQVEDLVDMSMSTLAIERDVRVEAERFNASEGVYKRIAFAHDPRLEAVATRFSDGQLLPSSIMELSRMSDPLDTLGETFELLLALEVDIRSMRREFERVLENRPGPVEGQVPHEDGSYFIESCDEPDQLELHLDNLIFSAFSGLLDTDLQGGQRPDFEAALQLARMAKFLDGRSLFAWAALKEILIHRLCIDKPMGGEKRALMAELAMCAQKLVDLDSVDPNHHLLHAFCMLAIDEDERNKGFQDLKEEGDSVGQMGKGEWLGGVMGDFDSDVRLPYRRMARASLESARCILLSRGGDDTVELLFLHFLQGVIGGEFPSNFSNMDLSHLIHLGDSVIDEFVSTYLPVRPSESSAVG